MSLSHVAEDSALRNEDDETGYRTETAWLRLMPIASDSARKVRSARRARQHDSRADQVIE